MDTLVDVIDGEGIYYNNTTDILSYKNNYCRLTDLLEAVISPIDRIKINNTDLLLIKGYDYYKIGCLKIFKEDFKSYKKIINKSKKLKK